MARQLADDLLKVSQLSEEVGTWYEQRTSDVAIFTPGCWERVRFLEFLVEELRGAKMAYCFPESEQEQTKEIDGRLVELEEPFVCDENEGDEKCNERLPNYRQMMVHKTRKSRVRTVFGLLTGTNECQWCRSRFVDRETALHHVYKQKENASSISLDGNILILPDDLQCRLCDHEAQNFEQFQLHARSHHAGPQGVLKTSDGRMESGQESDSRGRRKQRERQQAAQEWRQGIKQASARSAASYEDTLGRSIVALQKLSLKHDQGSASSQTSGSRPNHCKQ